MSEEVVDERRLLRFIEYKLTLAIEAKTSAFKVWLGEDLVQ